MISAPAESARILVIDDDPLVRLTAAEVLQRSGHRVLSAEDAEQGLGVFADQRPDLVLLDVLLPGMSGFEACGLIRQHPAGERVPVLMMTGLDDKESIHLAYTSGATDFITKPIVWDLLSYRVRYALRAGQTLEQLISSQGLLASAQRIAHMGSWQWHCASGHVERSEEIFRIVGLERSTVAPTLEALLEHVHPQDRQAVRDALAAAREGTPYGMDFRIVRPDGSVRRVFEQAEVSRGASGAVTGLRGITQDITERVEAEARLRFLSNYDTLTGLANRTFFLEMSRQSLEQSRRRSVSCAVLVLDLDRFKRVNETFGLRFGDRVLRAVGERLISSLRAADIKGVIQSTPQSEVVARQGGDEFALFLFDIQRSGAISRVVERILASMSEPIVVDGQDITITASAGIALFPLDGNDIDTLLRNAETAMHAAKGGGAKQVRFYNCEMGALAEKKLIVETALRKAIDNGELHLHYQAKVDAADQRVVGAEVLMRWHHPERGVVSPADFIPVAEESGLIVPMTAWAIRTVCSQLSLWRRQGIARTPISVNLSAASFRQDGLIETVHDALRDYGVEPGLLEFEVTESILMDDTDRSVALLHGLKAIGVKLAVDDFGTGYSSLTYLKRFPIDVLKIDRSFVKDVTVDSGDAAITSAIIAMGQNLRLHVVAEGVETEAQADFLLDRGCRTMQGFLFFKPVPAARFTEVLLAAANAGTLTAAQT